MPYVRYVIGLVQVLPECVHKFHPLRSLFEISYSCQWFGRSYRIVCSTYPKGSAYCPTIDTTCVTCCYSLNCVFLSWVKRWPPTRSCFCYFLIRILNLSAWHYECFRCNIDCSNLNYSSSFSLSIPWPCISLMSITPPIVSFLFSYYIPSA